MNSEDIVDGYVKKCVEELLRDQEFNNYTLNVRNNDKVVTYFSDTIHVAAYTKSNKLKKLNLFIKIAKKDEQFRKFLDVHEMFRREIYVFKNIIPQFVSLQEKKLVVNQFKSYPKFYASSDENLREIVILDDLVKNGFKTSERSMNLDIECALLVMRELGRWHALSFAVRDQQPHIFKDYIVNLKDIEYHGTTGEASKSFIETLFPSFMNAVQSENDHSANQCERISEIKDTLFYRVQKTVEAETAEPYSVINHGDMWSTNLLFKYDELSRPIEICMVDYQASRMCSPVSDISQFIFTCLSTETRNKHYKNLIRSYYESLSSFLHELGSNPEQLFPYSVLQDHLQRFSIIGLTLAIKTICFNTISTENSPKFESAEDASGCAQLFQNTEKDVDLYNKMVRNVVSDYIQLGYDL